MPCKVTSKPERGRCASVCSQQDHEDIIVESQKIRTTKSTTKTHMGHIVDRGHVTMSHNNMKQKSIPAPKAMNIPTARTAVDKDWDKWRMIRITSNKQHSPHISASVFLMSINGNRDLALHPRVVWSVIVMASSRPLARCGEGPMAPSNENESDDFHNGTPIGRNDERVQCPKQIHHTQRNPGAYGSKSRVPKQS